MVRALSIVHNLAAQKRFRQAKARVGDIGTHWGTPVETPTYYSPCDGDPQNGTPNLGKPPYWDNGNKMETAIKGLGRD